MTCVCIIGKTPHDILHRWIINRELVDRDSKSKTKKEEQRKKKGNVRREEMPNHGIADTNPIWDSDRQPEEPREGKLPVSEEHTCVPHEGTPAKSFRWREVPLFHIRRVKHKLLEADPNWESRMVIFQVQETIAVSIRCSATRSPVQVLLFRFL